MRIIAYSQNLIDQSKIRNALGEYELLFASSDVLQNANVDVIIIDLDAADAVKILDQFDANRVVGFGSHVNISRHQEVSGRAIVVIPRSTFFADIRGAVEAKLDSIADEKITMMRHE